MSFQLRRASKAPLLICLACLVCAALVPGVYAQTGIGVSPATVNLGTVGRGGTASQDMKIYNTGDSAINYTITAQGVNKTAISLTPNQGTVGPGDNTSVAVTVQPGNEANGNYTVLLLVNTSASSGSSGVLVLPALAPKATWTVNGVAAQPTQTNGNAVNVSLIAGVFVCLAAIACAVAYWSRRG